jgi:hypothetical protein
MDTPLGINKLIVAYCTLLCFINSTNIFIYVFNLVLSIEVYIIVAQFYVLCNIWQHGHKIRHVKEIPYVSMDTK